jgi:RNA-binding protein
MDSTTRNFLRKRAHDLKPMVMVGRQGADERISHALDEALVSHELVKVRFQDYQDERRELAESLAASVGAEVVSIVGHVAIIFRQNEEKEKRIIHIPKSHQKG